MRSMLSVLQIAPDGRIFVARLSYSAMLVAIGAGLTWRFARSLNQVDSFAGRLVTQVRQAEDQLKASFAREEERARAAALALERTRLMRDLHDGLGGQLVSIVALSERGDASAPIGDAATDKKAARGLRTMRSRATRCGIELELSSGAGGTRVRLTLPRRFPDSDTAGA